ncbi:MAG: hypothetical protein LBD22_00495 [Spirochaetaceae bacterium]|jgi:uncharacterized membrane protein YcgQ (UPF0703/DUF1980 family)|nr:hypothetical protein [Spirochaetaceae bacterium]
MKTVRIILSVGLMLLVVCCKNKTEALAESAQSDQKTAAKEDIIEIKEKLFITQVNDVYLNQDEYVGKTIKLEGLFKHEQYADDDFCFVLRYGPGCCGNDGYAGFEVVWDKNAAHNGYPAEDDWVEATGVLSYFNEDDYPRLYIALKDLSILPRRGAEYVSQ